MLPQTLTAMVSMVTPGMADQTVTTLSLSPNVAGGSCAWGRCARASPVSLAAASAFA
jgi:hypothetical protein